jgi:pyruvate/2-oxoglutarate dehydrogenase complex dihydrolipoamide dehydrogenase (E3) component
MQHFDFCVIGAGSAGFNAALRARDLGKSVVILEQEGELAGLCILRGCMPAKTVLRSAQIAHEVEASENFGIETPRLQVNPKAIVQRKRRVVREFAQDRIREIEAFALLRGKPHFTGPGEVQIGHEHVGAERFLIATGSTIVEPDIAGLGACGYLTSDDALELTTLPESILILGGGPVGCEFAQYFARLGASVTLLQDAGELLFNEDPDVGKAVREALESDGVQVVLGATFNGAAHCNGSRQLTAQIHGSPRTFHAQAIFVAMNRRANIASLDLDRAGVRYDARGILVDEHLRTSNERIYAAGDVIGRRMLVHLAETAGRMAANNAFAFDPCPLDFDLHEVHSIYTQPEVAVAGLSEFQCRDRGIAYEVAGYPFSDHGRAITMDLPEGFVKMLASPDGTILGVTFVGGECSDFIHEAVALLYFKAKVYEVANMPHLHPTMAEIITYPAEKLTQRLGLESKLVCGAR